MSGPRIVFGQGVPCPVCKLSGMARGSGLTERERDALRKAGQPIPTMHPCPTCGARGYVDRVTADADRPEPEPER